MIEIICSRRENPYAPYRMPSIIGKGLSCHGQRGCGNERRHLCLLYPGNYYNFHPGSHVGQGIEKGIELIAGHLNQAMFPEQTTTVLLETMAGKGSEVGHSFEELRAIMDSVTLNDKLGVCLDTCHVWDGGYDIATHLDGLLTEFECIIGIDRLKAIHIIVTWRALATSTREFSSSLAPKRIPSFALIFIFLPFTFHLHFKDY